MLDIGVQPMNPFQVVPRFNVLKKGEVWLASSSHERECYLFPNQNESEKVMHIRGLAAAIEDE